MPTRMIQIAAISILMATIGYAGTPVMPPMVDGRFQYQEVVVVEGVPKPELYNRAKVYFAENFRSAPDVIKLDDKENGTIIARGMFAMPFLAASVDVWFSMKFELKDGRYRVTISDLQRGPLDGSGFVPLDEPGAFIKANGEPRIGWKGAFENMNTHFLEMLAQIKTAMGKPSKAADF